MINSDLLQNDPPFGIGFHEAFAELVVLVDESEQCLTDESEIEVFLKPFQAAYRLTSEGGLGGLIAPVIASSRIWVSENEDVMLSEDGLK